MKKIIYFIIGSFLFVGLPMLVWGVGDIHGYLSNPYRFLYSIVMVIGTLMSIIFVPNQGRGANAGEKLIVRQRLVILYLQIASFLFVIISPLMDKHGFLAISSAPILRAIGLGFTLAGYFMMNWSVQVLGKQFSVNVTIQKEHELITRRPYNVIRHPRYLGIILFFGGISLVFNSLLSLGLLVFTIVVLLWRISDEEKLLAREFGEKWTEYVKKTKRLVPYVY